jgi:hypothetical protein
MREKVRGIPNYKFRKAASDDSRPPPDGVGLNAAIGTVL